MTLIIILFQPILLYILKSLYYQNLYLSLLLSTFVFIYLTALIMSTIVMFLYRENNLVDAGCMTDSFDHEDNNIHELENVWNFDDDDDNHSFFYAR